MSASLGGVRSNSRVSFQVESNETGLSGLVTFGVNLGGFSKAKPVVNPSVSAPLSQNVQANQDQVSCASGVTEEGDFTPSNLGLSNGLTRFSLEPFTVVPQLGIKTFSLSSVGEPSQLCDCSNKSSESSSSKRANLFYS